MSVPLCTWVLALRQMVRSVARFVPSRLGQDAMTGVAEFLVSRLADPSQKVPAALNRSSARAWRALEITLAGEGLLNCLDRAEDKAFRQQLRTFLSSVPNLAGKRTAEWRQTCLRELRAFCKAGKHLAVKPDPSEVVRRSSAFLKFTDHAQAVDSEWAILGQIGVTLSQEGYPHLGELVGQRVGDHPSLLALAVRFYFRIEVENDKQLFQGLTYEQLDNLGQDLQAGFANLGEALQSHSERLETIFESLQTVMEQTHETVLDLKAESQRQGAVQQDIYQVVLALQQKLDMVGGRELRPRDSLSIRNDQERDAVKQLVARYRALPPERRQQLPALLNAIGKLEVAAGDFESAQKDFTTVAGLVGASPSARAEANFNAYQAALEQGRFDVALSELRQSVALDPGRFSPFPWHKYEPVRILGAGGFGVTFHCRYKATGGNVAVKALTPDGMERNVEAVFQEAGALDQIQHPAIVRLRECDFADNARQRPYLVMEYVEGLTLEAHVRQHGPLSLAPFLTVARPVAEALRAAHARGVLHRDVKPANLLVGQGTSEPWTVKLIDFGLAMKQSMLVEAGPTARQGKTITGASIAGTIDYAAPEQMGKMPGARVGPAADVYGFGRTCCFALFGTPNPLGGHWRKVPEDLALLLEDCLHEQPQQRLADFDAVLRRLAGLAAPASTSAHRKEPVVVATVVSSPPLPPGGPMDEPRRPASDKRQRQEQAQRETPRSSRHDEEGEPGVELLPMEESLKEAEQTLQELRAERFASFVPWYHERFKTLFEMPSAAFYPCSFLLWAVYGFLWIPIWFTLSKSRRDRSRDASLDRAIADQEWRLHEILREPPHEDRARSIARQIKNAKQSLEVLQLKRCRFLAWYKNRFGYYLLPPILFWLSTFLVWLCYGFVWIPLYFLLSRIARDSSLDASLDIAISNYEIRLQRLVKQA